MQMCPGGVTLGGVSGLVILGSEKIQHRTDILKFRDAKENSNG